MAGKKISNKLVALSSAAIFAVYAAGFARTRPAADRFTERGDHRRPVATTPAPNSKASAGVRPDAPPEHDERRATASATRFGAGIVPSAASDSAPASVNVQPSNAVPVPAAAEPTVSNSGSPTSSTSSAPLTATAAPNASASTTADTSVVRTYGSTPAGVAASKDGDDATPADNVAAVDVPAPAPAPVAAPVAPAGNAAGGYRDGTYYGWGYSRHGDIQAYVVIQNGKIAGVGIQQCLTRYPCDIIGNLPAQVLSRQSPEVDNVSGATQSVDAFYGAVAEALSKSR